MACIVCRSAVPAGASGCQKCTLPCCSRCMNDHQIRCEGWCEGKCKTCQALRPLVKCVRCSTWICTGCMDNEFGGPCCLYCALACRRAGVSIHQSPSIAGSRPLTASQPQPQAASQPVNLFDMGSTQPPPPPTAPPPPVAQPRPAAPSQPVVQPRPTAYQQPYQQQSPLQQQPYQQQQQQQQQQQAPPQPYQQQQPYGTPFAQPAYQQQQQPYQQQPAAYGYPAVNPAYVPPQAPLVQPTVKTPVQPGPQAAVKQPPPVPAAAPPVQPQRPQAALPGPVLTVMSTLPEKAARVLDQVHMTIGDFGDLFFADGTEGQGRLVGVSGDFGVFEMDTGERRHILLTNIFSFAKDESKSSPITPVATNARKIIKMDFVGGGAQGQVYTARYEDEREARIVVKEINFKPNEVAQADLQEQKARELMSMRHEHLIQYLDVRRISPSQLWIVMPYYKENDMVNFLENLRQPLSEYALSSLVLQIASALHFLHTRSPPRLHRDVKLDNILMFDQGTRTMLVDMDFSRTMPENNRAAMSRVGTYEYMAPEVERGRSSPASDMWSLGVILYVLLIMPDTLLMKHPNGTTMPFNSPEWTQEVLERTLRKEAQDSVRRRRINPPYSIELVNLMCALLQKDERCRPTAAQTKEALENVMLQCLVRGDAPTR